MIKVTNHKCSEKNIRSITSYNIIAFYNVNMCSLDITVYVSPRLKGFLQNNAIVNRFFFTHFLKSCFQCPKKGDVVWSPMRQLSIHFKRGRNWWFWNDRTDYISKIVLTLAEFSNWLLEDIIFWHFLLPKLHFNTFRPLLTPYTILKVFCIKINHNCTL